MRKITFLKMMFVAIALVVGSVSVWGQVNISAGNTITQDFSIGTSATASLPTGWKADKLTSARTLGTYASAVSATERSDGNSLSTTAGNGIYNFGAGVAASATDRAVGGLSSSSASKSVNVYVQLTNNGTSLIDNFTINYNVEKYRNGSNAAGFSIQMYYSTNGSTWTSAGSDFLTSFTADADNAGFASAPGTTVSISNKVLNQSLASGSSIYLAWNYSVTSGTTTSNSQALGIDDVSINAIGGTICTPSTLAFTNTTVNKTTADAAFTQTATSLNGTTATTYASNNTAVATVSATSGEVTLVGAGVAIITATQAAGTHSAVDYCAATATYTLNVASILPTITVTEVNVPAMVALVGNTKTETVNVSGVNLAENLTVSIIDDVDNQFDEPSVTSITKLGDNTATGTITVTYRPTAAGTHTATLKIESLGATSVTRALSGTGIDPNNPYSLDNSSPVSELNEGFEAPTAVGFTMPTNWKNLSAVGTKAWEVKLFSANQYAQMSAFGSTGVQQTMLISPAINFDQIVKNNVTFGWIAGYAKVGTTLKVYTMTLNGTKTEVKSINTDVPASGYAATFTTETLDLSSTTGVKFLVFEYNGDGGAAALTTTYQIDNIVVLKDLGTGISNAKNSIEVSVANGNINFSALAGESVEVYSAVGQKLVQKLTINGLNSIPVSARGVVLVKIGNRFAKVIL